MTRLYILKLMLICFGCMVFSPNVFPGVFKTQDVALETTFSEADTVVRKTLFLDDEQINTLQDKSRSKFSSQIISYYVGLKDGSPIGYAFFEDQIVRTKKAIVMVVLLPDGTVENVEVLAFYEPEDYLPIERWFELFFGKRLTANLWPGKQIHAVTGATLSVHSFTLCTRRALALYELID